MDYLLLQNCSFNRLFPTGLNSGEFTDEMDRSSVKLYISTVESDHLEMWHFITTYTDLLLSRFNSQLFP